MTCPVAGYDVQYVGVPMQRNGQSVETGMLFSVIEVAVAAGEPGMRVRVHRNSFGGPFWDSSKNFMQIEMAVKSSSRPSLLALESGDLAGMISDRAGIQARFKKSFVEGKRLQESPRSRLALREIQELTSLCTECTSMDQLTQGLCHACYFRKKPASEITWRNAFSGKPLPIEQRATREIEMLYLARHLEIPQTLLDRSPDLPDGTPTFVVRKELDTTCGNFPCNSLLNHRHCPVCDDLMVHPSPACSCECEICQQGICDLCCVRIGGFVTCATCLIEDSYPDLTKRMKFVDKLNEQAFQKRDLNENVLPKRSRREGLRQDRFPYNMPSMPAA